MLTANHQPVYPAFNNCCNLFYVWLSKPVIVCPKTHLNTLSAHENSLSLGSINLGFVSTQTCTTNSFVYNPVGVIFSSCRCHFQLRHIACILSGSPSP